MFHPRRRVRSSPVIFGEVGEALELLGVFVTILASLAIMVVLGKWWQT